MHAHVLLYILKKEEYNNLLEESEPETMAICSWSNYIKSKKNENREIMYSCLLPVTGNVVSFSNSHVSALNPIILLSFF